jgi:hypothetical protein
MEVLSQPPGFLGACRYFQYSRESGIALKGPTKVSPYLRAFSRNPPGEEGFSARNAVLGLSFVLIVLLGLDTSGGMDDPTKTARTPKPL